MDEHEEVLDIGEQPEDGAWDDVLDDNVPSLDPNDPLLRRVQAAIFKTLEENNERLTLEFRGQTEELRRVKLSREESGVELYTVQQQLAKLQMQLERSHEQFNIMSQMRERSEEDNTQMSDVYQSRKLELQEQRKKLQKYQAEPD